MQKERSQHCGADCKAAQGREVKLSCAREHRKRSISVCKPPTPLKPARGSDEQLQLEQGGQSPTWRYSCAKERRVKDQAELAALNATLPLTGCTCAHREARTLLSVGLA